ncbi:hypothetical protein Rsub_02929 [Raphidocelis subcapitata]|uniref:Uncharacterized protein n=1 Tax=Raphidocelis subcapitata TaxID=307507 RepID=A0A2V0NR24_9CHLO|nr:hypothetical protein Rsub_02929 [Raphidocelis subcapitata]|eukprot:GBF89759.1 hypothetical protein Rsub_02929 [Raphidocelis subcapitata]
MNALTWPSGRPAGHYRRGRTTGAPRKRTQLMLFSRYTTGLARAAAPAAGRSGLDSADGGSGYGSGAGRGGGAGGNGGSWGRPWGRDDGEGEGKRRPQGVTVAAATLATLLAAGAAAPAVAQASRAARGGDEASGPAGCLLACAALALPAPVAGDVAAAPARDDVLPGPSRLTRLEVMLYDPPQYRVKDTILIH